MSEYAHGQLPCGIEYAVAPLPRRHIITFQLRMLTGACSEPADKLGLARLVAETIDKGTQQRSGQELSDAFDAIGATRSITCGRETTTLTCSVLPKHFDRAIALHAELLCTPTFPEDAFDINVELAEQELIALEDDPQALTDKYISRRAYGPLLGRHTLGEADSLARITRNDLLDHYRKQYAAGKMLASVAGAVEPTRVADALQAAFNGFSDAQPRGRSTFPLEFSPGAQHYEKDLEQEQIGICFPGVEATHDDFAVQQVLLGVLAGGMSGRLFTEVREKQGLVYWVSAWQETPRGAGMIFLGASTTPQRCDKTYNTLLREVDRLADDIEKDELDRAITGIVAHYETRGDTTQSHCVDLCADLLFHGQPVAVEKKIADVQAVTIEDIQRYLSTYPRDRRCVVTLGPRPLTESVDVAVTTGGEKAG